MNKEALSATLKSKQVTFFSRSKNRLWTKGETSGHFLNLVDLKMDCDQDTILIKVKPQGPACHTGTDTCFKETNHQSFNLNKLAHIIKERKAASPDASYTAKLFDNGINKIAQKVGEEAIEVLLEGIGETPERLTAETADLLYHTLVLLTANGIPLQNVLNVLRRRHQKKSGD